MGHPGIRTKAEIDWPTVRIDQLKAMYAANAKLSEIGKELGVSRNTVAGKVMRLGLEKRGSGWHRRAEDTWSPGEVTTLRAMWAAGDAIRAIGRTMERADGSILSKALRLGLERRKPPIKQRPRPHRFPSSQRPAEPVREIFQGADYEAPATRKTLLELGQRDCRWPCWNAFETDQFFCAAPQADGKPYYPTHCAIAYAPPPRLTNARVRYNEAVAA